MSKNNICPIIARNYHSRWSRFCSLPNEVKEGIVELLIAANGFGIEALMAQERLNRLYSMSDEDIVTAFNSSLAKKTKN